MSGQDKPDRHAALAAGAVPNPSAGQRSNLLIIEDALIRSTIIAHIAEEVGFTTETAGRYYEACYLMYSRQFDCITLDLGLGQHDACEVLYHLWKIGCKVPVIIISGVEKAICDETARIGRWLGLNVCEPVRKPIDLKALREMLEHVRMLSGPEKLASTSSALC